MDLLAEKVYTNPNCNSNNIDRLKRLLDAVEIIEIFEGDPRAYAGGEVLVITAKPLGLLGLRLEDCTEYYYPSQSKEFYIEVCYDEEYRGAIQISNADGEFKGWLE